MALIQTLKRHPLLTYFVLVYVLSWACWIPLAILVIAGRSAPFSFSKDTTHLLFLGNLMPSLLGILLTALFSGKSGLGEFFRRLGRVRVPLIWYAVVLLLLPVLQFIAVGVPTLLGLTSMTFAWSGVVVLFAFTAGFIEEFGWRGFALPRMQARQPALAAGLLLGVLWGFWHLPLEIAIGQLPLTSVGLVGYIYFLLMITGWSVLFTWVYNNTRGSLFLMILFHAVSDIAPFTILPTSNTLIVSVLYQILLWFVVTIVVVRTGAAQLSRKVVVASA